MSVSHSRRSDGREVKHDRRTMLQTSCEHLVLVWQCRYCGHQSCLQQSEQEHKTTLHQKLHCTVLVTTWRPRISAVTFTGLMRRTRNAVAAAAATAFRGSRHRLIAANSTSHHSSPFISSDGGSCMEQSPRFYHFTSASSLPAFKQVTWLVVTEVRSESAVTTTHVTCCDAFSSSSVVSRAFSAPCVYSTFEHHPHPLGYLYVKYRFFRDPRCWASL